MNENLENLMYSSGLTAQGCWDEMDTYSKDAIQELCESIVFECMKIAVFKGDAATGRAIKEHFGISMMSKEEDEYDVVKDALQTKYDKLSGMMSNVEYGWGLMDQIRMQQMDRLKEAMKVWDNYIKGNDNGKN